ncbi:MAG: RNA-directed DNA polymerase [Clostridia bacterium]
MEAKKLLGRGLFPKEMIPPFNSLMLESKFEEIKSKLNGYKNKTGKCINFNIPRLKSTRRKMGIPNPSNYYHLCKEIENNWTDIEKIIEKSKMSLSKPSIKDEGISYVVTEHQFPEITVKKVLNSLSAKYMVYADISRFHGTIYTHSIPWALHGKSIAKSNINSDLYGNNIDKCFRSLQDNQTLGIPTGPSCSYIMAETIASKIDDQIRKTLSIRIKMIRYIDDFYFFCDSINETELVISTLAKVLGEYELELNPTKTIVHKLPVEFENIWISELRLNTFSSSVKKQEKDLISYFSKVINYARQFEGEFVFKYGISRIKNLKFNKENWAIYQSLLFQSMIAEPSIMRVVLEILLKYDKIGYTVRKRDLTNTIYLILDYHCIHGNYYEILWSLWIAKSFSIKLNKNYGNMLVKVDNPLVAVMVKHMQDEKLISKTLNKSVWTEHENNDDLYSEYWIYTYEALQRDWLKTSNKFQIQCTFFKALETYDVTFFEPNNQINLESFVDFDDDKIKCLKDLIELTRTLIKNGTASHEELEKVEHALVESIGVKFGDIEY